MTTRIFTLPRLLAILALLAVAVGFALSFFELIVVGIAAAIVAAALGLRRGRPRRATA